MENNCNKIEMRKKYLYLTKEEGEQQKKYIGIKNTSEGMKQRVKEAEVTIIAWEAIAAAEAIRYRHAI